MCVTNGYTEVLEWWKETEIVELFGIAVQSPQRMVRMLDCLYEIGYQQAASYVKDALEILIVHWAEKWLQGDGATWDSCVISCAEENWYNHVVERARENGCPEP